MKTERKCGNCFFYRNALEVTGECSAPVPASVRFASFARFRKVMFDTDGTTCPAHRMRSSRKVAASHQAQAGGEA
jgi:hypothetical protein